MLSADELQRIKSSLQRQKKANSQIVCVPRNKYLLPDFNETGKVPKRDRK